MRFYAREQNLTEIVEELGQLGMYLSVYQKKIEEISRKMNWTNAQKAVISQSLFKVAEMVTEQANGLCIMSESLVRIMDIYHDTEVRIVSLCEEGWITVIRDQKTRTILLEHYDYVQKIEAAYQKADGLAKELYDKYQSVIVIVSMNVENSYHKNGALYLAYQDDIKDPRGAESIYYHETGHFIVEKEGWVKGRTMSNEFQDFDQAVEEDVSRYITEIEQQQRARFEKKYSGKRLEMLVEQETVAFLEQELDGKHRHVLNGVSDMIDAVSKDKYSITYGHGEGYWEANSTRRANEAFAHMYSADFCKDVKEIEFIKEHFPNAYREYKKLVQAALESEEK